MWNKSLSDLTPTPEPSPIPKRKEARDGGRTSVAAPALPLLVGGQSTGVEEWVPTEPSDHGDRTFDYGESMLGVAERELAALKADFEAKEAKKRLLEMEERVHRMRDTHEATVDYGVSSPPAKRQVVSADGGSTSAPTWGFHWNHDS